ncbi:hypothetical protein [Saccharobesus litoralis]|uniref:hypothetical protein n=1 Tax=Saccharobesus litoralis TaxID=2172099 RepID=UPI00131EDD44|nr:hypothetical protein [Saccharobesus litoralis]
MLPIYIRQFILLIALTLVSSLSIAESDFKAKIGIMVSSQSKDFQARPFQRLRAGDQLQPQILTKDKSYVYVVHFDKSTATLLNHGSTNQATTQVTLPDNNNMYQLDGNSSKENFTIVASNKPLEAIESSFSNASIPLKQWKKLAKSLSKKPALELDYKPEKHIAMAGNVRSLGSGYAASALKEYAGKDIIVRNYVFTVKK